MTKRLLKPPKKCIFCGINNATSKEHFYPNWIGPLLRQPGETHYVDGRSSYHALHGWETRQERRRQGQPISRKLRVVCVPCNTGWMKKREEACAPTLRKFALGQEFALAQPEAAELARWVATKAILLEHTASNDAVTPVADRKALMEFGTVPPYFRIYLGAHIVKDRQGVIRFSSTFFRGVDGRPVPALEGVTRNTQQLTFLLGHAFFHVTAARIDNFEFSRNLFSIRELATGCHRIFPAQARPVLWPPDFVFAAKAIETLANSLQTHVRSGVVPWLDETPS